MTTIRCAGTVKERKNSLIVVTLIFHLRYVFIRLTFGYCSQKTLMGEASAAH